MKVFKRILFFICAAGLLIGILTCVACGPISMPDDPEILYEVEPAANPLRVSQKINGVGGSRFFIQSPKRGVLTRVDVSQFGVSIHNPDNSEALNDAFEYCKDHPGMQLTFEKGVYYVSGALRLEGVKDVCIDGNGAKILYDYGNILVSIEHCQCIEIRDLSFDWDWDKIPLGATARAINVKGQKNTIDFVFDVPELAQENMFYAITQCDEDTNTYGAKGTLIEFYDENHNEFKSIRKISEDTIRVVHSGALARFDGNKFILRSTAYGGNLFHIGRCHDITLENLFLYGGGGMGIIIGDRTSHFALRNLFIGPNPEYADVRCVSFGADAVHINDADGCFVIENCDFSRQGDDDVNINNGIGVIKSIDEKTILFEADGSMKVEPGDRVAFRDKRFNLIEGFSAVVECCGYAKNGGKWITFSEKLPSKIKTGYMFLNLDSTGNNYVIRNNYFHEHRARGLLLQTSNGLVENNVFYKISHDAIRIVMDINGVWHEGTGADNIEIRNNRFIECGLIGTEIIEVGTHIMDKSSGSYSFTNIRIENNDFRDICGNLLAINNVNNFIFSKNTITIGNLYPPDIGQGRAYFLRYCANVDFSDNTYTDAKSLTKIARSDNPIFWVRVNAGALQKKERKDE